MAKVKVIVVGDAGVGKTSLIRRFRGEGFSENRLATFSPDLTQIFVDQHGAMLESAPQEGAPFTLNILEIPGQKQFHTLNEKVCKDTGVVLLLFDLTDRNSFTAIDSWIEEVAQHCGSRDFPLVLVGTKSDLVEQRLVSDAEIKAKADELGCHYVGKSNYIMSSATNDEDIKLIVQSVVKVSRLHTEGSSQVLVPPTVWEKHSRKIIAAIITAVCLVVGAVLMPLFAPVAVSLLVGSTSVFGLTVIGAVVGVAVGAMVLGFVFAIQALVKRFGSTKDYDRVEENALSNSVEMDLFDDYDRDLNEFTHSHSSSQRGRANKPGALPDFPVDDRESDAPINTTESRVALSESQNKIIKRIAIAGKKEIGELKGKVKNLFHNDERFEFSDVSELDDIQESYDAIFLFIDIADPSFGGEINRLATLFKNDVNKEKPIFLVCDSVVCLTNEENLKNLYSKCKANSIATEENISKKTRELFGLSQQVVAQNQDGSASVSIGTFLKNVLSEHAAILPIVGFTMLSILAFAGGVIAVGIACAVGAFSLVVLEIAAAFMPKFFQKHLPQSCFAEEDEPKSSGIKFDGAGSSQKAALARMNIGDRQSLLNSDDTLEFNAGVIAVSASPLAQAGVNRTDKRESGLGTGYEQLRSQI